MWIQFKLLFFGIVFSFLFSSFSFAGWFSSRSTESPFQNGVSVYRLIVKEGKSLHKLGVIEGYSPFLRKYQIRWNSINGDPINARKTKSYSPSELAFEAEEIDGKKPGQWVALKSNLSPTQ